MKTLTTEELHKRLDKGPLALFDVRGDIEYEIAHIPGAKTAPLGSLTFRVASIMNPDSAVVVYSGGSDCSLASQAAQRLENLKMQNVFCYQEGMQGWQDAGYSLVSSPSAKVHTQGPVINCRPLLVDRKTSYGGVFMNEPTDVEGAGG